MLQEKTLAVYVHWPFCLSKCPYCNFTSFPENDQSIYRIVENLLQLDLKNELEKIGGRRIVSVFFGGGTPSLIDPAAIGNILNLLEKMCLMDDNAEISLEANPQTFDKKKMQDFRSVGVNRISLGVQSFQSENLKFLGRIYDGSTALAAAEIVSDIFQNFSMDFIYGYQGLKEWKNDLSTTLNFGLRHISTYQLTIEENTPFFHRQSGRVLMAATNEKHVAKLHYFAHKFLEDNGLRQYEISNYAATNYESRHNLVYWTYGDYLGIGPSAHSRITLDGKKYEIEKISIPQNWINSLENGGDGVCHSKVLSPPEELEETLLMGLRLTDGIKLNERGAALPLPEEKIRFLQENNLMENDREHLRLTYSGRNRLNSVLEFLLADLDAIDSTSSLSSAS
ncbi:MAG: radical SAM family heme chaperone HemW [Holosporaceae bacterium]|jgi:oxygen-independent coproporphyrinogen-3 oxidase|nr:radical SAM family heme chaperone HemW [Holosporaceae bacterium]